MSRTRATWVGFTAVLMWALLALLTVRTAPVPPLLLNAITFGIGGAVGLVWLTVTRGWRDLAKVPVKVYAFGTVALFGYHLLYFTALRLAPPAEASLIAYLWPLFIVLLSGFLPGEHLTRLHIAGAAMAFAGAAMIVMRDSGGLSLDQSKGLGLAFLAALTWSSYSVLSRRLGQVPTASVTIFCIGTALLSAMAHLALETPAWPVDTAGWLACFALGLGPVGLAFYTWDVGMKRGDIQLLGVAAYAAPLLSTLTLIAAGMAEATPRIAIAALLITAGALLAARAGVYKGKISSG